MIFDKSRGICREMGWLRARGKGGGAVFSFQISVFSFQIAGNQGDGAWRFGGKIASLESPKGVSVGGGLLAMNHSEPVLGPGVKGLDTEVRGSVKPVS